MKYTKFLINGKFIDIESLQTDNKILKYPVLFISIIAAIVGVVGITGILPVALIFDELRNTKYFILVLKRKRYKIPIPNKIPKWIQKRIDQLKLGNLYGF